MKYKVFIQQIISTEVELEIPEEMIGNLAARDNYIKEKIVTPNYAMNYYDKKVSKLPQYRNWTLDNETILITETLPNNTISKPKIIYSVEDGYND
ncbi:MAG: hypothetical protein J6N78_01950 [Clostridia bacterium]|nr:hypothetical protein [Clostridia bacterium]